MADAGASPIREKTRQMPSLVSVFGTSATIIFTINSHAALLRVVSRRIHVTFAIPVRERQAAVRFLCSRVIPISSGVRLDG